MKNKVFLMIMVVMVCSLTACGQQETGTMTNTGNSTEQVVVSEDNSEPATAEDNNMEQTETKEQNQLQDVKPSYKEFFCLFQIIYIKCNMFNSHDYSSTSVLISCLIICLFSSTILQLCSIPLPIHLSMYLFHHKYKQHLFDPYSDHLPVNRP